MEGFVCFLIFISQDSCRYGLIETTRSGWRPCVFSAASTFLNLKICLMAYIIDPNQNTNTFWQQTTVLKTPAKNSKTILPLSRSGFTVEQHSHPVFRFYYNSWMLKKQILHVDYKEDQGIILEWNYRDLSLHSKFYRHILLLYSDQTQKAQEFVEKYVRRIKPGDFYLTIYANQKQVLCCRNWRQKLVSEEPSIKRYLRESISANIQQEMMDRVKKQYSIFSQPIIFNVFLQDTSDAAYFQQKINANRLQGHFQFICSLFGPFNKSQISVNHGLNLLSTVCEPLTTMMMYYHKQYINQMAIRHAVLSINCKNGTIVSHDEKEWQNESYSCIVRNFYGPSALYKKDVLSFINSNLAESGSYELTIHLKFQCFDGVSYQSCKDLVIRFDRNRIHKMTFPLQRGNSHSYIAKNGIELITTPYITSTMIIFSNNIEGESQEID